MRAAAMTVARLLLGAAGTALAAVGAVRLLTGTRPGTVGDVLVWGGSLLVLHDGVLVPAVLAVGLLSAGGRLGGVWRAGLLTAGTVTLVASPVLLRPGRPANPSVLPLDYPLGLALVLSAVAAATCATAGWLRWRRRRTPRPSSVTRS
ncbi:hypothetical protein AB0F36_08945 [Streptomyces sp. NPDC029080]